MSISHLPYFIQTHTEVPKILSEAEALAHSMLGIGSQSDTTYVTQGVVLGALGHPTAMKCISSINKQNKELKKLRDIFSTVYSLDDQPYNVNFKKILFNIQTIKRNIVDIFTSQDPLLSNNTTKKKSLLIPYELPVMEVSPLEDLFQSQSNKKRIIYPSVDQLALQLFFLLKSIKYLHVEPSFQASTLYTTALTKDISSHRVITIFKITSIIEIARLNLYLTHSHPSLQSTIRGTINFFLSRSPLYFYGILHRGMIAGIAGAYRDVMYENSLCCKIIIHPKKTGIGIEEALLYTLSEQMARVPNVNQLHIITHCNNPDIQNFYQKHHFINVGYSDYGNQEYCAHLVKQIKPV